MCTLEGIMQRTLIMVTVLAFLALLPSGAHATYFEEIVFTPDCTGFTAETRIHIHPIVERIDMTVQIDFIDADGVSVLTIHVAETVVDEDGDGYETPELVAEWNDLTDEIVPLYGPYTIRGDFTLTFEVPVTGETISRSETASGSVECSVVPNTDATWGGVRSTYRP
jgi:hypothetical protein